MPTYEFMCPDGHTFDKFYRKISDAVSELPCTTCEQVAVRQVSGGIGLLFKGSGFYITDYGKDGKKGMPKPPAAAGSSGSGNGGEQGGGVSAGKSSGESKSSASSTTSSSE